MRKFGVIEVGDSEMKSMEFEASNAEDAAIAYACEIEEDCLVDVTCLENGRVFRFKIESVTEFKATQVFK